MTTAISTRTWPQFSGSYTALITPFRDQNVDEDALRRLVEFQIDDGIDGLVIGGTTGEAATLSPMELDRVISRVLEQTDGQVPIIAGTGSNNTVSAVERTVQMHEAGVDAALVVVPYYNKPTQAGMIRHFSMIADASDLPLILYNVPGRTGVNMAAETTLELAEIPSIVAVKEASGNLDQISEIARHAPQGFAVLSGDDALTLPIMSVGGHGVISVVSNIVPGLTAGLVAAARSGDFQSALHLHQELLPLSRALFLENNPMGVKAAAAMLGLCRDETRPPLADLTSGTRHEIERVLRAAELIEPRAMAAD